MAIADLFRGEGGQLAETNTHVTWLCSKRKEANFIWEKNSQRKIGFHFEGIIWAGRSINKENLVSQKHSFSRSDQ